MTANANTSANMGYVQSEGGSIATGVTTIPSLGSEAPILLSFKSPIVSINLDGQLTGTIANLSSEIDKWKTLITTQGNFTNSTTMLTFNSTLSGAYQVKIVDFSWSWSHAPSSAILNYKVALAQGTDF